MRVWISLATLLITVSASASDTPRMTYIKTKCAVCHGSDGSGNTPEGKRRGAPDLRAPAVQKKSDAELGKLINDGHARMPSFNKQLTPQQVAALVAYMRVLGAGQQ